MVTAYRIYYTTFYDEEHERIVKQLAALLKKEPRIHQSRIREFRYVEFVGEDLPRGLEEDIKRVVRSILGDDAYVRVDYINL